VGTFGWICALYKSSYFILHFIVLTLNRNRACQATEKLFSLLCKISSHDCTPSRSQDPSGERSYGVPQLCCKKYHEYSSNLLVDHFTIFAVRCCAARFPSIRFLWHRDNAVNKPWGKPAWLTVLRCVGVCFYSVCNQAKLRRTSNSDFAADNSNSNSPQSG
jgi:hypothetical protein